MDAQPDALVAGAGPTVILLHASVSGARQWRVTMETLSDRFRVIAVNLHGYGETPRWTGPEPQTLADQARLVLPVLPADGAPVRIVGHSFGGSVAMKAAAILGARVDRLVLIEPNPFTLLQQENRASFAEAQALCAIIRAAGRTGNWTEAARQFATYWTGPGSWEAMPSHRRTGFAEALRPNLHEWDAVMNEQATLDDWHRDLPAHTTVIHAADTVRSIAEIVDVMQRGTNWTFRQIPEGGHMAPLVRPETVLPVLAEALG